jgi:tetratricopeptide (TPR) repeat protein
MNKRNAQRRRLLVIASVVMGLSLATGIGLCQVEPSGRKAGLVQFDAVSELNMDSREQTNTVIFARYWVCADYYAAAVVWTEPHGQGVVTMKTLIVLSDATDFRMDYEQIPDHTSKNTTYRKPVGERGPFQWGGGLYQMAEIRFAEAKAVSRRVYASDLRSFKGVDRNAGRSVDVNVAEGLGGNKRELARLTVQAKGGRIESMELFDERQQLLGRMNYQYERDGSASGLTRLIAELPVRPEKLTVKGEVVVTPTSGNPKDRYTYRIDTMDHVYHQGGRTCTVAYQDVTLGDKILRLPVHVEVRVSDSKQPLRSARLANFKHVDLDKAGVWEAAKAFARLDSEYPTWIRLVTKYINHRPRLGPLQVDPNDHAFVRELMAKYPVPDRTGLSLPEPRAERQPSLGELDLEAQVQERRERFAARRQAAMEQTRRIQMMPQPRRMDIEPNDARLMRQLYAHYMTISRPDEKTEMDMENRLLTVTIRKGDEISRLVQDLHRILTYHRAPQLPEDRPPELDANDRQLITQLQEHYERLVTQTNRGLGGQLQALHALTRLDRMLQDYDAFEDHTRRYLQMLDDANLPAMYLVGGCDNIETLMEAGQYEKANQLLRQWADKSAADNDADAIFRFCRSDLGGSSNPWLSVQLLDRLLRRSGLAALQRYEGMALRAIALDKIDKLLTSLETIDSESRRAQGRWILSMTTGAALAQRVGPSLRQAQSAWQALGPVGQTEARPYSTANATPMEMNIMGYSEATALQETSAELDRIIRERSAQMERRPPGSRQR